MAVVVLLLVLAQWPDLCGLILTSLLWVLHSFADSA